MAFMYTVSAILSAPALTCLGLTSIRLPISLLCWYSTLVKVNSDYCLSHTLVLFVFSGEILFVSLGKFWSF